MGHEIMRHDADKAGSEAALRHKGAGGPFAQDTNLIRDFHIFGQVEVMDAMREGQPCDSRVAVIGKAGDDGIDRMGGEISADSIRMPDIEDAGCDPFKSEIFNETLGGV